jgi:hypothetical protein
MVVELDDEKRFCIVLTSMFAGERRVDQIQGSAT